MWWWWQLLLVPLVVRSYGRRSLDGGGCVAAWLMGTLLSVCAGWRVLICLVSFFLLGTVATRVGSAYKARPGYDAAGHRSWRQVVANGGVCTIAQVMHTLSGRYDVCWPALAALSAALGDTLASELAPLADAQPKLVTHPWRQVPVGTNGGVTLAGLFLSIVGGWIIGALYALTARAPSIAVFELVVLCGLFGLIGSLIDSLLGALLERDPEERDPEELQRPHERDHSDEKRDGHCDGKRAGPSLWAVLDNDQVNFISTTTAAALASLML